jgi:hypothetical protein
MELSAQGHKHRNIAASIFDTTSILEQIFAWIGPGHHLFLATVCQGWRQLQECTNAIQVNNLFRFRAPKLLCTPQTTLYSAVFASKAFVKTAHEGGLPLVKSGWSLQHLAGRTADLAVLQLAHELGLKLSVEVVRGAAMSASLAKLEWLHKNMKCELPDDICNFAASSGRVDVLRWLMQRGCHLSSDAYTYAAECDQWDMLKVLRAEGCVWEEDNSEPCSIAMQKGNIEAVRWLHENGCPESITDVSRLAAEADSVEGLSYAKEPGCVFTARLVERAAEKGNIRALEFLHAEQCPMTAVA